MDPKDAPLEDLLAGLDTSCVNPGSPVETWMKSEGYAPGCHRLLISELYKRYMVWHMQHTGSPRGILAPAEWALELGKYVRLGRGKKGQFAYIGRILPRAEQGRE